MPVDWLAHPQDLARLQLLLEHLVRLPRDRQEQVMTAVLAMVEPTDPPPLLPPIPLPIPVVIEGAEEIMTDEDAAWPPTVALAAPVELVWRAESAHGRRWRL